MWSICIRNIMTCPFLKAGFILLRWKKKLLCILLFQRYCFVVKRNLLSFSFKSLYEILTLLVADLAAELVFFVVLLLSLKTIINDRHLTSYRPNDPYISVLSNHKFLCGLETVYILYPSLFEFDFFTAIISGRTYNVVPLDWIVTHGWIILNFILFDETLSSIINFWSVFFHLNFSCFSSQQLRPFVYDQYSNIFLNIF